MTASDRPSQRPSAVESTPATGASAVVGEAASSLWERIRGGDLGSLPVIIGLVLICTVFQILNPVFLSPVNLVNLTMQCAAIGTIALGIVVVLLVGEIDLSVGSVSGLAAAIVAVGFVEQGWPLAVAILVALIVGCLIGALYGMLFARFGLPSFVITLAGLLGFLGVQLWVLGDSGSINIPFDSWLVQFAQQMFLPPWMAYAASVAAAAGFAWVHVSRARRRTAANLLSEGYRAIALRTILLLVFLLGVSWYLNLSRGVGVMFLSFVLLVVVMNYALTRTRWGRAVYAVGGSSEAARRAGIRVNRIYLSAFCLCATLAAAGGILAAGRLAAANQSSGAADTNLNAIAAAVIGGASLFGGRGSAFSALLGIVVIQSISSGLTLLNLDSSIRFIVTGTVLVLAVIVDSMSRRTRASHGRA
ncbi:sugar ABC transporter permease [Microbacterium sp. C7(2022)]|uniref:sugar ABC transporter permease n=1 Tax=Microbacterium sp. C7(2022) TaxID=2992759 RepID=UPI00237A9457|nr:sugar ABC transporter permease [Microbacterium sp. C7(2022)]MDE0545851.1 sugar ABC transporter permease [Microbacterium sp. C7(2022)]